MSAELPEYFFRVRDNGALVFRVNTADRSRRIEMDQIAAVNIRSGEVKPHGDRDLTAGDQAAITDWVAARRDILAARDVDDILRSIDTLNQTAQWAQAKATDEELELVTDTMLLAMHDLRTILVRRKADRTLRDRGMA